MIDGNHVVASKAKRPWVKQLNVLLAYMYFYNPLRLLKALVFPKNRRGHFADAGAQLFGTLGWIQNWRRTLPSLYRLMRGRIVRYEKARTTPIPMRGVQGGKAPHGLPHQVASKEEAAACGEPLGTASRSS
jgi:hypothetical protein